MTTHPSIAGIRLVLGGNVFGWTADEDASFAVLDAFYEAGGRMIDTAQAYSVWIEGHVGGESEAVIGKWLESRGVRADMRIGTKTGMMGFAEDLAPDAVAEELDKSLERLRTDYVDLYYAHRDSDQTPLAEIAKGFDALVKAGKVREVGASNFTAERLSAAIAAAESIGAVPYTVLQNEYNLVKRDQYEGAVQDLCVEKGIAALPFYGLASGFLTGKYRSEADLKKSERGRSAVRYLEKGLPVLAAMDEISAETGSSLPAIALAWLNAQPGVAAPLASARNVRQLETLIEGARLQLSDEQVSRLTAAGE
jgi:aryl-alcohol dehydrogenase-like predicted oxidoreductase